MRRMLPTLVALKNDGFDSLSFSRHFLEQAYDIPKDSMHNRFLFRLEIWATKTFGSHIKERIPPARVTDIVVSTERKLLVLSRNTDSICPDKHSEKMLT